MSNVLSIRFFYSLALCIMIRYGKQEAGTSSTKVKSLLSQHLHGNSPHTTIITIETEYFNPISQDFYDNTIYSIDLTLLPFEPADYDVTARGSRFHLIIGEHNSRKYKNQYSVLLQTVLANS